MMRGDYQQQQRKRQRIDDDDRGSDPLSYSQQQQHQQGHRDDDRAERLERERRERMARLRADDKDGDGGLRTGPSTTSSISNVGEARSSRGLGRGKSLHDTQQNGDSSNTRKYHDNTDEGFSEKFHEHSIDDADKLDDDEGEKMRIMMGFGGFGTTKGKAVADNQHGAARGAASKNKGRKYRQYMNRKGGFNRPLDKMN